jgi:hypothetical protein
MEGQCFMRDREYHSDDLTGTTFEKVLGRLRDQPRLQTLQRVRGLTKNEFHNQFAAPGYPVILQDMTLTGPDEVRMKDMLRMTLGSRNAKARYGAYADPDNYVSRRLTKLVTVNDVLDRFEIDDGDKEHLYLANLEMDESYAGILGIASSRYCSSSDLRSPHLWLGSAGCITPLHMDGSDNFAIHLFGRKRWILFPVKDYPYLYMNQPNPRSFPGFACSHVDVRDPDYESFPLYRLACPLEVEIGPGEALYLPAGWAHYVESLSASLMVNYWTGSRRRPVCLENSL